MEQKFDSNLRLSHFEPGLIHPNHGVFVMSDEIEEQWDIPSLDDFSLGNLRALVWVSTQSNR